MEVKELVTALTMWRFSRAQQLGENFAGSLQFFYYM